MFRPYIVLCTRTQKEVISDQFLATKKSDKKIIKYAEGRGLPYHTLTKTTVHCHSFHPND